MSFDVKKKVQKHYGTIAKKINDGANKSCCSGLSCCSDVSKASLLYEKECLNELPEGAIEASLGCANPVTSAQLKEGEFVLDLGSGGGINVLMAAKHVGVTGKVYGLDMTDEMLELANKNKEKMNMTNVEFLKGFIEEIPLPDSVIDVVMSNCVINLSENKEKALAEAFRVLKPGGRLAIADIITLKDIPPKMKEQASTWCACFGGTLKSGEYKSILENVGFRDIEIVPEHIYTKSIVENVFINDEILNDVIKETDLDAIDKAFAGAYIRARKY